MIINLFLLLKIIYFISIIKCIFDLYNYVRLLQNNETKLNIKINIMEDKIQQLVDKFKNYKNIKLDLKKKKYNIIYKNNCYNNFYKHIKIEVLNIYEIKKKISSKANLNNILEYIFKNDNYNRKQKTRLKNRLYRSLYLYEMYGNKLKNIDFSISRLTDMSKKDWIVWIKELDNIIISNNENLIV